MPRWIGGRVLKSSDDSITRLVAAVVMLAITGGVIGHLAGVAILQFWFRQGDAPLCANLPPLPTYFSIVGCLLGILVGMGRAAYVAATGATSSVPKDPIPGSGRPGHDEAESG